MIGRSLLPAMLSALALMLAGTLVYQLVAPNAEYETPPFPARDRVPVVSLPEPFATPPLAGFREIDERPLFVPERRPFREAVAEAPPPAPRKPPEVTLVGVILDGKHRVAIAKVGGKSVTLT